MVTAPRRLLLAAAVAAAVQISPLLAATPALYVGPHNGLYSNPAHWSGGVVPNNSGGTTYDVTINNAPAAVTVLVDVAATLDTLTLTAGDGLTINDNRSLTVVGGLIANNGTLTVNSAGNITDLLLHGVTTLSGSGTLALSNRTQNRVYGSGTLTTSNLITGGGLFGLNSFAITNNGTITASASSGLRLDPADGPSSFTNNGVLRASGGTLFLDPGTYTGGTLEALSNSAIQVESNALVQNAVLQTDASGAAVSLNGGTVMNATSSGLILISDNRQGRVHGNLHNTGTLSLNSAGNITDLILTGPLSLTGGGTLLLSNRTSNRVYANSTAFTFTNANVLIGAGQLGVNLTTLNNTGTITATGSAGLSIDPRDGTGGFINAGVLRADGGPLFLQTGDYVNTGLIEARNGSAVQVGGNAVITGGTLTSDANPVSAVTLTGGVLANLTNTGQVVINDNQTGTAAGTITNAGVIRILSAGNLSNLIASGNVTFAGGGTITLSNRAQNRIYGAAGTERITFHNVVSGAGQIGLNLASITNHTLIVASTPAGLTLDPVDGPNGFINHATLRADGGNLLLAQGTYTNNGTIEARNGFDVTLGGSAVVVGGVLTTNGTASTVSMSGSLVDAVTNSGLLVVNDNNTATVRTSLVNNALLRLLSAGSLTNLVISGDTSLNGAGTLTMTNRAQNRIYGDAGARLTNNSRIEGAGQIGVDLIHITNNGLIVASSPVGISIDPLAGANGFVNNGTVQANGGPVNLNPGEYTNTGTFQALNSSLIVIHANAFVTGGTLTSAVSGAVVFAGGTVENVTNTGTLRIPDNSTGFFKGTLTNHGVLEFNSLGSLTNLISAGDATLAGAGTVTMTNRAQNRIYPSTGNRVTLNHVITGGGQIGADQGAVTNGGTITASLAAGIVLDPAAGANGFINTGVLRADGGNLSLNPGEYNNAGGTLQALNGSAVVIGGNANVTGGTLTSDANPASAVLLAGGQVANLTNTGVLAINDNNSGTVAGTLTNSGRIDLRSQGSLTNLIASGTVTLAGGGTVTALTNRTTNRIYGSTGGLLTTDNTIIGALSLGVDSIRIQNTGSIIANQAAGIVIDPADAADGFVNTGLLRADNAPLTFQNSTYTLGGTIEAVNGGTLHFAGGSYTFLSPVTLNSGNATFSTGGPVAAKAVTGTGTVTVNNGATVTSDAVTLNGTWQINGTHVIRSGTGNAGTSRVANVPVITAPSGRLDITDHVLVVDTTSLADKNTKIAALNAQLLSAQAGGAWTGRGITSAVAQAAPAGNGVGLFDNADLNRASLAGATMNSDTLFLAVAHYGDATFDGKVDAFDLNRLAANWQVGAHGTWSDGDFTYDGKVDAFDLNVLAANWQFGTAGSLEAGVSFTAAWAQAAPGGVAQVPEPATLVAMLAGVPVLLRRRRK